MLTHPAGFVESLQALAIPVDPERVEPLVSTEIELRAQWIHLGEDGILYVKIKAGVELELADAVEAVRVVGSLHKETIT